MRIRSFVPVIVMSAALACAASPTSLIAQHTTLNAADPAATAVYQRTRLILKSGSYQSVLSYKVNGDVVDYRSAERNGELEEIPLKLVDMPATLAWYHQHRSEEHTSELQSPC